MYKIAIILVSFILCACSTVRGDQPQLGMRFQQPYSSFVNGGTHDGLDIDVSLGTPVRSVADGVVAIVSTSNIRGNPTNVVMIKHENGYLSKYIHIENIKVKRGDDVKRGQILAVTALNGPAGPNTTMRVNYPHLHFEVLKDSRLINPESMGMNCSESGWLWPVGCKL